MNLRYLAILSLTLALVSSFETINWKQVQTDFHQTCSEFTCGKPYPYTQSVLALSWPGDFCHKYGRCVSGWQNHWDKKSFGIHGYWPGFDSKDLSCVFGKKCPDPNCKQPFYFFSTIKNSAIAHLEEELEKYWPEYNPSNKGSFRQNQWNKHGVCYLQLLKKLYPGQNYSDGQLFKTYFEDSIAKAKRFYGVLKKTNFENKAAFAQALGIGVNNFYADCYMKDYTTCSVKEIRICYDLGKPGEEKLTNCFQKDLNSERYKAVELSIPGYLKPRRSIQISDEAKVLGKQKEEDSTEGSQNSEATDKEQI